MGTRNWYDEECPKNQEMKVSPNVIIYHVLYISWHNWLQ